MKDDNQINSLKYMIRICLYTLIIFILQIFILRLRDFSLPVRIIGNIIIAIYMYVNIRELLKMIYETIYKHTKNYYDVLHILSIWIFVTLFISILIIGFFL